MDLYWLKKMNDFGFWQEKINQLAFLAREIGRDNSESVDTAYGSQDSVQNSTWTGYADEDMYEDTMTLTPASAYVAGDTIFLQFQRDLVGRIN